jgi:calcium/calmodulin-dependent protein kinase I
VFSAGVIFYLMLVGKQPFIGKDYKEVLNNNKKCKIDFTISEFQHIPDDAMDLLQAMLLSDPKERPSASLCLKHAFIMNDKYDPR